MKKFLIDNKYLVILWVLCAIALFFFVGHYNNILIDFGREVYYPERILEGKILYKDLFNIYGPFSYQFNAVLYKIFGVNLSTLYFSGILCSLAIVTGTYFIAKKFLTEFLSFAIGVFTIAVGVSTYIIFNFSFPYSWALLYGMVFFLYSVLFLIKFKNENKPNFLYLSSFFAGICIASKYEFAIYSLIVLGFIIYSGIKDWKIGLKAFSALLVVPVTCFGILFLQGLTFGDLISSLKIIKKMSETETLKYFYQTVGVYFHPKVLPILFESLVKAVVSIFALFLGVFLSNKNKMASFGVTVFAIILASYLFISTEKLTFVFLPILLLVCAIFGLRKYKNDIPLLIIVLCGIAMSLKSIWGMLLMSYSSYYVSFVLIAFLALLFKFIPAKYEKITAVYLILFSAYFILINSFSIDEMQNKITTEKGSIQTNKELADSTNYLINFLQKQTKPTDKVVVFPEGMMINFLANRKGDDFYNSLLPLYVETFGEERIIEHFHSTKPEYIIFNNESMSSYGFNHICNDYALDFCSFVFQNYNNVGVIDYGRKYLIFKKK